MSKETEKRYLNKVKRAFDIFAINLNVNKLCNFKKKPRNFYINLS